MTDQELVSKAIENSDVRGEVMQMAVTITLRRIDAPEAFDELARRIYDYTPEFEQEVLQRIVDAHLEEACIQAGISANSIENCELNADVWGDSIKIWYDCDINE